MAQQTNPRGCDRKMIVRIDATRQINVAHQHPSELFFNNLLEHSP